jgi:FMN-dependent NADH-azoreductase
MSKVLILESSSRHQGATTRELAGYFKGQWAQRFPQDAITEVDLFDDQVRFIDGDTIAANHSDGKDLSDKQKAGVAYSDRYIQYLMDNDVWVIGAPMYNFSVPAVLKAFIDQIVVPGKTFDYSTGVPKGLISGKRVIVLTASGGNYDNPPMSAMDFVEPYLRAVLGFLGVSDVTFVKVQGNHPEQIEAGKVAAKQVIDKLVVGQKVGV